MHDLSIYIITQYIPELNTMIYYFTKLKQSHSCTPLLFTDVVLLFTVYPRCYPMGYTFTTLPQTPTSIPVHTCTYICTDVYMGIVPVISYYLQF